MNLRIAAAALALAAIPALAHHGWSEYDSSQALTLTGKIELSGYGHPHGFVKLSPDTNAGTGDITVVGYPNRSKPDEMRAERITVDGRTVELR